MCSVCSDIRMNKKVTSLSVLTLLLLCVAMFPFIFFVINLQTVKVVFYAGGVSIVKQHVQVFNAWICDLPRQGIDIFLPYA